MSRTEIPLWPNGAPGAQGNNTTDIPAITHVFTPDIPNGRAIIVVPGGGYTTSTNWIEHEGKEPAQFFASKGYHTFVLRYRCNTYSYPIPLNDGRRAVRLIRANASKWNLNPSAIGMMGFSAGGHLTSYVGTHPDHNDAEAPDPVGRESCRPDFMILAYPVISMRRHVRHAGSSTSLLGASPSDRLVTDTSNDECVTSDTPPTFLVHGEQDTDVSPENSRLFKAALDRNGVAANLTLLGEHAHGFGLKGGWAQECVKWLDETAFRG